ncbi:hypothetical protein BU17DRAFT_58165, partial [Hysterangium stoloniferum]
QPTAFQIRQKNAEFSSKARAGKNPTKPSRAEALAKRSPIGTIHIYFEIGLWALGLILFLLCGGFIFELARLFFL